jgi:hypothetical protein
MFLGHFALGLAAKRAAPTASLGTLWLAAQLADLLWPIFLLARLEQVRIAPGITRVTPLDFTHYPISHSLVTLAGWGLVLGAAALLWRRTPKTAAILAALVVSHWALDAVAHRPDVPVLPSGPFVGLGLWNSLPATVAVELLLFSVGIAIYASRTKALDRVGSVGLWAILIFLLASWTGSLFGPPPPDVKTLAIVALSLWLLIPLAAWVDRHRVAAPRTSGAGP